MQRFLEGILGGICGRIFGGIPGELLHFRDYAGEIPRIIVEEIAKFVE